jgi:hypothetical protein
MTVTTRSELKLGEKGIARAGKRMAREFAICSLQNDTPWYVTGSCMRRGYTSCARTHSFRGFSQLDPTLIVLSAVAVEFDFCWPAASSVQTAQVLRTHLHLGLELLQATTPVCPNLLTPKRLQRI